MEDTFEVLATFLTTQSSITGPSLADRSKSMGANQACAALSYKNPRNNDGPAQPTSEGDNKSPGTQDQPQDADLAALQQKSKLNKQRSKQGKPGKEKSKSTKPAPINSLDEGQVDNDHEDHEDSPQTATDETASISGCSWFKN